MAANTNATLDGWIKKRYAEKAITAIPDPLKLLKLFPKLATLAPVGEEYVVPVTMKDPSGFTYAGASADAFALEPADPGLTVRSKLTANQLVLKDAIAWETQSITSEGKESAYGTVMSLVVRRMKKRFLHRLECSRLYGGTALGTAASVSTGVSLTMTKANWAPGIWIGAEGQKVDLYNSTTLVGTVKITAVNPETYILYGVFPAGAAGYTVYWAGAYGNEMVGIYTALTTTGTVWNISNNPAATPAGYSQWAGNTVDVGSAPLTWDNFIQKATEKAQNKGAEGEMLLMVNPSSWRGLMNDEAGLRRYDSSYSGKKASQGFEDIEFHGQNGLIRVTSYTMLKNKDALLICKDDWMAIGSQDVTFRPPLTGEGDPWVQPMQTNAGSSLTNYTNQTIFCEAPGHQTVFQNILPS